LEIPDKNEEFPSVGDGEGDTEGVGVIVAMVVVDVVIAVVEVVGGEGITVPFPFCILKNIVVRWSG
jgi:hypothetical protein